MERTRVFPSELVSDQSIKLTVCDAYSPKVWVTQTYFWPLEKTQPYERACDILKEGLSRTLSELPGFAGKIARASEDPRDLVINVGQKPCVEFTCEDLSAEAPSYAYLKAHSFPMTKLIVPFSPVITLTPVSEGAPMLAVKLNVLAGGIALSFGVNHLLADASAIAEMVRIWSSHTADVSNGVRAIHKHAGDDEGYRIRLSAGESGAATFEDENWKIFPTQLSQLNLPRQAVSAEAALTMLQKAKEDHLKAFDGSVDVPKWCIWYFSPDSLVQLKRDASGLDPNEWISTMDALIGLFWARLSFFKKSSVQGHNRSKLLFPINVRQRLVPPIDPHYIGNAVDIIAADCPLTDLEAGDDSALQTAALGVRRAVTGWKQSHWESWLSTACSLPADQAICPNPLMLLEKRNLTFNDYSKSNANLFNWGGELGCIDRIRYMKPAGSMAGCATGVVVHPRLADEGLEVSSTMEDGVRMALENDAVFMKYARLEGCYE